MSGGAFGGPAPVGLVGRFTQAILVVRVPLLAMFAVVMAVMGYFAVQIDIRTYFDDLVPRNHPYVKTNDEFRESFGGANLVSIMIETEQGDIFQPKVLQLIHDLQSGLQLISGVNQFQVISLASKKLKTVKATADGFAAETLMWPNAPTTAAAIDDLKAQVVGNPYVYGVYVSRDLKATLVTVDFIDRLVDYNKILPEIKALIAKNNIEGVRFRLVGQPVLVGRVIERLPETVTICITILIALTLFLNMSLGTWHGTTFPLVAAAFSAAWAFGTARLLGINLDPLGIVLIFLIAARTISHTVQMCMRYEEEYVALADRYPGGTIRLNLVASRMAVESLFRPGMLGLVIDIGAMAIVAITPIPLLIKAAVIGVVWLGGTVLCTVVVIPLMLSLVRPNEQLVRRRPPLAQVFLWLTNHIAQFVSHRGRCVGVVSGAVLLALVTAYLSTGLTIGDANAGSPILWPNSNYNQDDAAINSKFPGTDRMFLVIKGQENDTLKRPDVLKWVSAFQENIEAQPEIGGTLSMADIIRPVNMILHEGNPRYFTLGASSSANAELLFLAMAGSDPGDVDRFVDYRFKNGSVQMQFRDHKGSTIRTALQAINNFQAANKIDGAQLQLAGGYIGLVAAVNEVILADQVRSIAFALLILYGFCVLFYRSTQAGLFFLPVVLISNTVTFTFMALYGIGLNISNLPVAALGIGLGVDYAFYVADRIKEEYELCGDELTAIRLGINSAGLGVAITAICVTVSLLGWFVFSSVRFQAEMGLLIALWMFTSAVSALFIIPAMIHLFRPSFIFGRQELSGVVIQHNPA